MVLAKPGCSLSAINPPVMCSLHLSASHHWANIKQVFSGECGGSLSATPHYTKISPYIESSDIKELYFCQYGAWESTPHKQKLILPTKIHVDRQTWDLPCVDKHTKVSQESINPATTTLNNSISESGVQNSGVFQPKQIDSSFPEGEASTTRKEKVWDTSKKEWFALEFWLCNALSQGWWTDTHTLTHTQWRASSQAQRIHPSKDWLSHISC